MQLPASTLDPLETPAQDRVGALGRRIFLGLLALLVLAGLLGFLGVRSTTTSSTGDDGWRLEVTYAEVARAGLDVPLTVTVTHPGGFGDSVVLRLTGTYLDLFETQGFNPDPSAATRDGDTITYTFDAPPQGDTFVFSYDAYVQPSSQQGRSATLSLMDGDGGVLTSVDLATHLVP